MDTSHGRSPLLVGQCRCRQAYVPDVLGQRQCAHRRRHQAWDGSVAPADVQAAAFPQSETRPVKLGRFCLEIRFLLEQVGFQAIGNVGVPEIAEGWEVIVYRGFRDADDRRDERIVFQYDAPVLFCLSHACHGT